MLKTLFQRNGLLVQFFVWITNTVATTKNYPVSYTTKCFCYVDSCGIDLSRKTPITVGYNLTQVTVFSENNNGAKNTCFTFGF